MVRSARAVLGGDACEVADVLGEQRVAAGDRRGEDLGVGAAAKLQVSDRCCLDPGCSERLRQSGRVHLVHGHDPDVSTLGACLNHKPFLTTTVRRSNDRVIDTIRDRASGVVVGKFAMLLTSRAAETYTSTIGPPSGSGSANEAIPPPHTITRRSRCQRHVHVQRTRDSRTLRSRPFGDQTSCRDEI